MVMSYLAFTLFCPEVIRRPTKVELNFIKFISEGESRKFLTSFFLIVYYGLHSFPSNESTY